jgi:hypothetical protein
MRPAQTVYSTLDPFWCISPMTALSLGHKLQTQPGFACRVAPTTGEDGKMTQQVLAATAPRCLGRLMAHELTEEEIESVSGGISYTGISNFEWLDDEGNARFSYSDTQ